MADGVIPSEDAWRSVSEATRHYLGTYRNRVQEAERRKILGGGCSGRNEVWQLTIIGSPTGGTFDIDLNVLGTTDTLTFDYDFTAAEVETELETHTNIGSGDVDVTGGAFPNVTINIEFLGDLAKHAIPVPVIDFSSLTGGSGVGVLLARYRPGYPKDGSVAP